MDIEFDLDAYFGWNTESASPQGSKTSSPSKIDGSGVVCPEYDAAFTHSSDLKSHSLQHTGDKPHTCIICNKDFARVEYLRQHARTHTGERPYKCEECGKAYTRSAHLIQHKRSVHAGEKPYICPMCNKGFARVEYLRQHAWTHTGERPYKCEECGKVYTQPAHLIEHKRSVHTGERPYTCPECGTCFICSRNLTRHRRIHTDEKSRIFSIGNKAAAPSANLRQHVWTHNGDEPSTSAE